MRKSPRVAGLRDRLRNAFIDSGKTAEQLMKETGIGKSVFYRHLGGNSTPCALHLARYAAALNVSADWLLGLKKERRP